MILEPWNNKELIGYNNFFLYLKEFFDNKKLPNKIIFSGNKGIGKSTFSYFLINKIFSEKFGQLNSDLIYKNSHLNLKYINKIFDDKINKFNSYIKIDQIRDIESFAFKSSISDLPKFVIIDSADDLNINSSNSLLKLLEEPKKNTFFILIAHQLFNILPTIRSRCIKFKFENPPLDDFIKIIKLTNEDIEDSDINLLFDLSNGSPGLALDLYSNDMSNLLDNLFHILQHNNNFSSKVIDFSEFVGIYNNDQFKIFISILKLILINVLKVNLGIDIKNHFLSNISDSIYSVSKSMNNNSIFNIFEYLNLNEKDLYIYNLDKKIFSVNIFNSISK